MPTWLPAERMAEWAATRLELDGPAGPPERRHPGGRLALAERMMTLDGGTTPRPVEMAGRSLVPLGRADEGLELPARTAHGGHAAPGTGHGRRLSALRAAHQHWGQSAGTVEHWLRRAVETDPACVVDLAGYFTLSLPEARFWLSGEALAARSERMHWFLKNVSHLPVLDAGFARRALRVLPEDGRQRLAKELAARRRELRIEDRAEVNLLDTFWRERDGGPQPFTVVAGERGPVSRYGFVASGTRALNLDVTVATGPGLPEGTFAMRLNGHALGTRRMTARWRRHRIVLPSSLLRAGVNGLSCTWPVAARDPDVTAAALAGFGTGPENLHLARLAGLRLTP